MQLITEVYICNGESKCKYTAERHCDIAVSDKSKYPENEHDQKCRCEDSGDRDQDAGEYGSDIERHPCAFADSESQADPVQNNETQTDRKNSDNSEFRHNDLACGKRQRNKQLKVICRVQHRHDILDRKGKSHYQQSQHQPLRRAFGGNESCDKRLDIVHACSQSRSKSQQETAQQKLRRPRRYQRIAFSEGCFSITFLKNRYKLPDF